MERLEAGDAGGVIVFDLARFSRRPIEGERLIAVAERGLIVLDSESAYDLTTASGKKAFRDQMSAGAYESDRLSTRSRRGKRLKAMKGEPNTSRRPFGYRADRVIPDTAEAAIVREMAKRILDGEPMAGVAADLNARGIRGVRGALWDSAAVHTVLTHHQLAGIIAYKGEPVGRMQGEPILDMQTWERLQALFASRRQGRPPWDDYVASGIVRCGTCSGGVTGKTWLSCPKPDGGYKRVYTCKRCVGVNVDQIEMDNVLRELVVETLADPRHAAAVEAAAAERASRAEKLDAAIAEADATARALADRLGRGEITLDRYDAATGPLDRRLAEMRAQRAVLDVEVAAEPDPALATAAREQWQARWAEGTTTQRRSLLRQALRGRTLSILPVPRGPARSTPVVDRIEIN